MQRSRLPLRSSAIACSRAGSPIAPGRADARMDRLVVLDRGRIVEQGTHAELLRAGGTSARLWRRQSIGFVAEAAE